jgi:hypothetical protein
VLFSKLFALICLDIHVIMIGFTDALVHARALSESTTAGEPSQHNTNATVQQTGPPPMALRDKSSGKDSGARSQGTYAWPALWIFPFCVIMLLFLFKGPLLCFQRRSRQRAVNAQTQLHDIETGDRTEHIGHSETESNSALERSEERGARDIYFLLQRRTGDGSAERAYDEATFDPGLWRSMAIARDLESRRRRRQLEEDSTHRRPIVALPERVESASRYAAEANKAIGPASDVILRRLTRVVVGSPRWWQFLRANGHIASGVDHDGDTDPTVNIEECAVCCFDLAAEDTAIVLACAHAFHEECIISWLRIHASCPVCRCEVKKITMAQRANAFTRSRHTGD